MGGAARNLGMEVWSPLQRSEKSELGVSHAGRVFFALTVHYKLLIEA